MGKISILWPTVQDMWETEYVNNFLFDGFDVNVSNDCIKRDIFYDGCFIPYGSGDRTTNIAMKEYLRKYRGRKYFLYHMSDEWLANDCAEYADATWVFRNYTNPKITHPRVTTVPLGCKRGFIAASKTHVSNEKVFDFAFIGQLKNDRIEMVRQIEGFKSYIHLTDRWDCAKSLGVEDQVRIYSSTRLVPCPIGNFNVDTFRLCEVLQSRSIPVLKLYGGFDYYRTIFGPHPIPTVKDWNELPSLLENLKSYGIERKTDELQIWYKGYYALLRSRLKGIIESNS